MKTTWRPVGDGDDVMAARRAVAAYRSQLRALAMPGHPGVHDVFAPECLWSVEA